MRRSTETPPEVESRASRRILEELVVKPIVEENILKRAREDLASRSKGMSGEPMVPHPVLSRQEVSFCSFVAMNAWRHFEIRINPERVEEDNVKLFYGPKGLALLHWAGVEMLTCILETPESDAGVNERLSQAAKDGRAEAVGAAADMLDNQRLDCLGAVILRLVGRNFVPDVKFLRTDRGYGRIRGHFLVGDVLFTRTDDPFWSLLTACREHGATTLCVVQNLSEGPDPEPERARSEEEMVRLGDRLVPISVRRPGAARLSFFSLRSAVDPIALLDEVLDMLTAGQRNRRQEAVDVLREISGAAIQGNEK